MHGLILILIKSYPVRFSFLFQPIRIIVVPWYTLIHSRTPDECQAQWVLNDEAFSLARQCCDSYKFSKRSKSWASAKCWNFFFSSKYNEYRVWWVLKPTSTKVWLYFKGDSCALAGVTQLSCKPKGRRFTSQSGHMPGLRAKSPVEGVQEATNCTLMFLSLPLSKINK